MHTIKKIAKHTLKISHGIKHGVKVFSEIFKMGRGESK